MIGWLAANWDWLLTAAVIAVQTLVGWLMGYAAGSKRRSRLSATMVVERETTVYMGVAQDQNNPEWVKFSRYEEM